MAAEPLQPNMTLEAGNQPSEVRDLEEAKDTMLEAYRLLRAAGDVQAAADAVPKNCTSYSFSIQITSPLTGPRGAAKPHAAHRYS